MTKKYIVALTSEEREYQLLQVRVRNSSRHRAEISVKVYHMGVKALLCRAFSIRLKTGLILLSS